jgi:hypothetical protein
MGDKIVVMNHGVVEQFGTPQDIYDHPATLFVADFIGSPAMNFLRFEGTVRRRRPPSPSATPPSSPCPNCRNRPPASSSLASAPNMSRSPTPPPPRPDRGVEYLGTTQIVTLSTPFGPVKARIPSGQPPAGRRNRHRPQPSTARTPVALRRHHRPRPPHRRQRRGPSWLRSRSPASPNPSAPPRRCGRHDDHPRRRLRRPPRPHRRGQDHHPPPHRRPRPPRQRATSASTAAPSSTTPPPSATWRWSSSNTRSTPTSPCATTSPSPSAPHDRDAREPEIAKRVAEVAEVLRIPHKLDNKATAAFGRRDAARLHRPRPCPQPPHLPDGRTPLLARRQTPRRPADRAQAHPRRHGRTFLYVTHDQIEAMTMATHVGVLDQGKLVQFGTPREIYETPSPPMSPPASASRASTSCPPTPSRAPPPAPPRSACAPNTSTIGEASPPPSAASNTWATRPACTLTLGPHEIITLPTPHPPRPRRCLPSAPKTRSGSTPAATASDGRRPMKQFMNSQGHAGHRGDRRPAPHLRRQAGAAGRLSPYQGRHPHRLGPVQGRPRLGRRLGA